MTGRRGVAVPLLLLAAHCSSSSNFAGAVGDQEIMEAASECFPGWQLVNNECVKELARRPLSRCPPKATFVDGACVFERAVRPSLVCGESQALVGERCEYEERLAAVSSCPKGFVFDGQSCLRSQETPGGLACPSGYVLGSDPTQPCVRESKHKPSLLCPPGSESFGADLCMQREEAPPTRTCGLGYAPDADGSCAKYDTSKVELRCPPGQRLEEGVCRSSRKVAALAVCPPDHSFDGRECLRVDLAEPTASCPPGFSLNEGRCIKVIEREALLLCPAGFELVDDKCARRSALKAKAECPEGSVSTTILGKTHCEVVSTCSPQPTCPPDFAMDGDRCVRRSEGRQSVSCPLGFVPYGEACSREHLVKPTEVCSAGSTLRDGFCVVSETVPSRLACEADASPTPQGTCVKLFSADMVYSCPKGFLQAGSCCTRKTYTQAATLCPPETRLRGAECVAVETHPSVPFCEPNFQPHPNGYCVKLDVKPPKRTCPKTHKLFNHYCVQKADPANSALPGLAALAI